MQEYDIVIKINKFSGKELDDETGYNYFGARYYDSDLSNWLSVDPMSDSRPNVSPFAYCQNNPVVRIDPNGALDDNYSVDVQGNIKLEEKTNDKFDVLYTKASWDNGKKDKSITVDKGILNQNISGSVTAAHPGDKPKTTPFNMYAMKGDYKALKLYKFLANNSPQAEWGHLSLGDGINILMTGHRPDVESGIDAYLLMLNHPSINNFLKSFNGYDHSHPNGLESWPGDFKFAKYIEKYYNENAVFRVYEVGKNTWDMYDSEGSITHYKDN
jgi:RHS repeat-associated protein